MKTRDEILSFFKKKGFHAVKRDWAMGKTVAIYYGEKEPFNKIRLFEGCWFIIDNEETGWSVDDGYKTQISEITLDEAAEWLLERLDPPLHATLA